MGSPLVFSPEFAILFEMRNLFLKLGLWAAVSLVVALGAKSAFCEDEPSAFSPNLVQSLIKAGLSPGAIPVLEQEITREDYDKNVAGIVDFSLPSDKPRFFVIHFDTAKFEVFHVAHGANSGGLLAQSFSNVSGSDQSSLGFVRTGEIYSGKFGRSLRLRGLSASNSNIASRTIVLHSAEYSSAQFLAKYGFWGRSFGCFAVPQDNVDQIIDALGSGALILAFHNDLWEQSKLRPDRQKMEDAAPPPPATAWETEENNDGDPHRHHEGDSPTSYYKRRFGDLVD